MHIEWMQDDGLFMTKMGHLSKSEERWEYTSGDPIEEYVVRKANGVRLARLARQQRLVVDVQVRAYSAHSLCRSVMLRSNFTPSTNTRFSSYVINITSAMLRVENTTNR